MGAVAAGMGAVGEEEEEDRSSLAADSAEDSTEEGMVVGIVTISGGIGRGIRTTHIPQFDLRNNMRGNQNNLGKETHDHPENSGKQEEAAQSNNRNGSGDTAQRDQTDNREQEGQKSGEQRDRQSNLSEVCARCGKGGHKPEACGNPVVCSNCQKEGHVARVCSELHPWDHIAPFCGLAAPGQGFFFIHSGGEEEDVKELISCALITITKGSVTGRQLENEFKALAGPTSTWRWYAKKVADNCFQMRFPAGKKVEELSFFTSMQMRTVPDVFFKVEKWSPSIGAKAEMQSAWFRVKGIPIGKRSEKNICRVASFVGLPLQVDKANSKKFDYVRVKIGAKDVAKIPAVVEGMLDFFFYDFEFQREVPIEGMTNVAGNKWVRVDKPGDDHPSPKKPRMGEFQSMPAGSHQKESGTSGTSKGKGLSEDVHMLGQQVGAENSSHGQKVTENMELIEGDSEDKGLQIGDLVSPGCESLQFGAFQINEAKKIWHFQINDNISAAINEYGTNMFLSKSDPLAAIEAKNTILEGKKNYLLAVTQGEHQNKAAEVLRAVVEEDTEEKIISQEPPLVDWSSQEELMEVREEVQGERESDVLVEQESEQELNLSSHEVQLPEATNDKAADEENEQRQSSEIGDQAADFQDSRRQSVRLKNQGQGSVKTTEKAEALLMKKNLEGLQHGMDKDAVEGAGMLKATALHFHPHEAGADDHGMVLLQ